MNTILVGSTNPGKIKEYKAMLEPLGFQVLSLRDMDGSIEVEETGNTFLENAFLKAKTIANQYHMPLIVDDSGLEVEALGGRPGIHSRRYSPSHTDYDNNQKLLKELSGKTNRKARFVCHLVFFEPESGFRSYEGTLEGEIAESMVVENGFGYDPIFYIPFLKKMMSELTEQEKNQCSHRGMAMRRWLADVGIKL